MRGEAVQPVGDAALGFTVRYRQVRPNPYVALEGHGFPLHYYRLEGHRAEESYSTCGVVGADTGALMEARGPSGFSLIDPAGNWIRILCDGAEQPMGEVSPLRESLLNAIVLADSNGDSAQALKILQGAVRRADRADVAMSEALEFLDELHARLSWQRDAAPSIGSGH